MGVWPSSCITLAGHVRRLIGIDATRTVPLHVMACRPCLMIVSNMDQWLCRYIHLLHANASTTMSKLLNGRGLDLPVLAVNTGRQSTTSASRMAKSPNYGHDACHFNGHFLPLDFDQVVRIFEEIVKHRKSCTAALTCQAYRDSVSTYPSTLTSLRGDTICMSHLLGP